MTEVTGALALLAERAPPSLLGERHEGFPHLLAARAHTSASLDDLRARLSLVPRDGDAAVVLFGSWGRAELTEGSDADWSLLVDGPPRASAHPTAEELSGHLPRPPSQEGSFGAVVSCDELVENVGLRADSWDNLTLRMLLALESVAIAGEDVHARCRSRVLSTYTREVDPFRPPRFFLNDLIRYWRTIAVDFEGKARAEGGAKWGARLAKLRTSRKVLFAGGLVPILLCHLYDGDAIPGFLEEQLAAPATDRLAHAFLRFGAVDSGLRALGAYDRWIGLLGDSGARAELESLGRERAGSSEVFREALRVGDELEAGLLALLFDTPLRGLVREYGVF